VITVITVESTNELKYCLDYKSKYFCYFMCVLLPLFHESRELHIQTGMQEKSFMTILPLISWEQGRKIATFQRIFVNEF
jgi:hypothetical protein